MKMWLLFGINITVLVSCGILYYKMSEQQSMLSYMKRDIEIRIDHASSKIESHSINGGDSSSAIVLKNKLDDLGSKMELVHSKYTATGNVCHNCKETDAKISSLIDVQQQIFRSLSNLENMCNRINTSLGNNHSINNNLTNASSEILSKIKLLEDEQYVTNRKIDDLTNSINSEIQYIKKVRRR